MIDVPIIVREALKKSVYEKNYRFRVMKKETPTELDFEIDNENLVAESVQIDEKMCSGDTLEFGLCEGSTLEFQYFGLPNITSRSVWAFIDCQYRDTDGVLKWYEIPMGRFDVKECSRQASTGIIKAICYNKLLSDYLDEKANDKIANIISDGFEDGKISVDGILNGLLNDYSVKKDIADGAEQISGETVIEYSNWLYDYDYPAYCVYKGTGEKGILDFSPINNPRKRYTIPQGANVKRIRIKGLSKYAEVIDNILSILESETIDAFGVDTFFDYFVGTIGYVNSSDLSTHDYIGLMYTDIQNNAINGKKIVMTKQPNVVKNPRVIGHYVDELEFDVRGQSELGKIYVNFSFPYSLVHVANTKTPFWFTEIYNISQPTSYGRYTYDELVQQMNDALSQIEVWIVPDDGKEELNDVVLNQTELPDVTLRQLQSAVFESQCKFGKLDRITDLFSGVTLNGKRLLPKNSLYPYETLYPVSESEHSEKAMYSKLWADEGNIRKFRYLIVTYKGLDEEGKEEEKILQRTVNNDGTDDYNMSDNWIFKNMVWSEEQIGVYADQMVENMKNVTWFPFEMWSAGLPYLETGDEIEIAMDGKSYTSYVLQKQTKGVQDLQDTYINGTLNIF